MDVKKILKELTIEEKAALLSGKNEWASRDLPRLNINSIVFSDGPHGIRRQEGAGDHLGLYASLPATCFPTAATVANSWDQKLGYEIGEALGEEAKAQGVDVLLGPGLNIKRSPLCGRNFEYFSEDPYLSGKMAASYIRGIQSQCVYACPKHFAVNSRETRRMAMNAVVDERTLREIYLTAFEIAIKEGGAKAIMSAYNEVNGKYANENEHLLLDILRGEWEFDGIVVTDWGGSNDHVAGVKCRSNMEMPNPGFDSARELLKAYELGVISMEEIDMALMPILEASEYFKGNKKSDFDYEAHHILAKKAAVNSAVLLKNEGSILPLRRGTRVAIRGPFSEKPRYQGAGSSQVNATRVENVVSEIGKYDLQVVEDVRQADVVLFFFGLDEIAESEGADRLSMDVPEYQIRELEELAVLNPNIVGVMSAGSSVKMPWLGKIKALLHGYLSGQAGISALLDIIVGREFPSGRLSESYPFNYADSSIFNYANVKYRNLQYREGPFVGYRYYDKAAIDVHFPFGYGLSYTTIEYSEISVSEDGVSFTLTNTGNCRGAEVAQLYIGMSDSMLIRPLKELKGFEKVWLEPGQSKQVHIPFDDKTFRYYNVLTEGWEEEPGEYQIMIGANVEDIRLQAVIYRKGTKAPAPYDIEKLPSYKAGLVRNVHYEEFLCLYGKPLPEERKEKIDINDPICMMEDAKSRFCRWICRILKKKLDTANEKGIPDLNILFIYNMPFRAISKMSGGMVSREMAEAMVTVANGHFFRGMAGIVRGFIKNRKANKEYLKHLNAKEEGKT